MALNRIFGDRAPYKHVQTYWVNPSDTWMQREQERLSDIAIDLGIDIRINRSGNRIEMAFGNVKSASLMRLRAFGNDYNHGQQ